ncbi:MAG: hypothetical protein HYS27_21615 [Deltaproteobacteria bacterium]|nr:hypothetical protein [Deltaproteobacteria bacterium]
MLRLPLPAWPALAALPLLLAPAARAAQITDVADAVDETDPFDAYLEVKFDVTRHAGMLTRENTQPPEGDPTGTPRSADVREMSFEHVKFRIKPRLEVGVFRDLSVFAEWPIIIWQQQTWRYAEGVDDSKSTLKRDQACGDGSKVGEDGLCPDGATPTTPPTVDGWPETRGSGNTRPEINNGAYGFPANTYNAWAFDHGASGGFTGYRQGFDNPTFGARFSPVNNERDDTFPTITLQADYTAPFLQFMNPTTDEIEDPQNPGSVSDGAHRFHFQIAMSKRFLVLDPYFSLDYGFGLPASGNGSLEGYFPRQAGTFMVGTEIIPYEDKKLQQRFAIDVAAFATYYSEGRDYTEISDVVREQTYTDQHVRSGLKGGIFFKAIEYLFFDINGTIAQDSEHLLTIEDFGTDSTSDTNVQINLDNPSERNPYYNPAIDTVGRRLKVEQVLYLGVMVHAGITF